LPTYRIPKDEVVVTAIARVTAARHLIPSQRQLRRLVAKALRGEENYRVSGARVRRLAIDSGLVSLQIICRESAEKTRTMVRCPVCGERVRRVRNMTVWGGTVTLGFRCPTCGYWTGLRRRIPTRYVFTRR
jgi:DNA-directed RNA polymerase subunit RPC12/RpoP